MRLFIVLLILMSSLCFAQQNAVFKSVKVVPTTLPTKCIAGDLRVNSAGSDVLSYCNPSNTWNTALVSQGGLTFSGGDIVYSTGTSLALAAAGTTGQYLMSQGSSAPTWSGRSYYNGYSAGDCGWTSAFSLIGPFAPIAACTLIQTKSYNFPTVTSYDNGGGNFLPGITFTPSGLDITYEVCAHTYQSNDTATSSQAWVLSDQGGVLIAGARSAQASAGTSINVQSSLNLCGMYETNKLIPTNISIRTSTTSGITTLGGGYSGTTGNQVIQWVLNKVSN